MTPRVSVLLPVRNGERFVAEAIESILAQTEPDFELIVVDDGSTDATPDIIRRFDDPRIRVVTQEPLALVAALNRGLDEARASYVVRQDADDVSAPTRIERLVEVLDADPRVAVVSTWHGPIDDDGGAVARGLELAVGPDDLRRTLLIGNPMGAVGARRDVLLQVGGYRSDYLHNEDYDLWRRVAERYDLAVVPEVLYRVRAHADAVSTKFADVQAHHRERILDELWRSPRALAGVGARQVLRGARRSRASERAVDSYIDVQLAFARALRARGHSARAARVALGAVLAQPSRLRKVAQRTTSE
jgi:glycosyltransferase involved in cell wall biosynthesis